MAHFIEIDEKKVPVSFRKNKQAKRLILRMNPKSDGVLVTLPPYGDEKDGLKMAEKNKVWIANQLTKKPDVQVVTPNSNISFRGVETNIIHDAKRRGTVVFENDAIIVCGQLDFFQRRLRDWLKKEAKTDISHYAYPMAEQINKRIKHIILKDTISRWGSCSYQGGLNFNWRLIMAPPHILRYVVAHEVAHLVHMDHSPNFWNVVDDLHPAHKRDRHWLKKHGSTLQSISFDR